MGRGFRSEIVIGLCVLVVFVLGAIFFSDVPPLEHIQSLRTWQEADAPPGYPVEVSEENPDGRVPVFAGDFVLLDGFARFGFPPVSRLDWPLGTEAGALIWSAQPFLAHNEGSGGRHLGIDLAALGAEDTDSGVPVYAAGNGVVVYTSGGEGPMDRIVIIGHRLPEGRIVHSLYAPLQAVEVGCGAAVARGQRIGQTRRVPESCPADLHFEIYDGALIDPGDGYASRMRNRRDPDEMLARHRPVAGDDLAPEPLAVYEAEEQAFRIGPGGFPVPLEE